MKKTKLRVLICLLAVMLCMAAFSATALADGGDYHDGEEPIETPTVTEQPFTPEGNLSLIDDLGDSGSKQFITVQSKSGNYFYIIIDRAGDTENVYFLNLVDEADLLALMDEPEPEAPAVCTCKDKCYAGHVDTSCPVCATDMSKCTGKETKPEPTTVPNEQASETSNKKSVSKLVLVIVLLLAVGGGAAYYFLKVKGKAKPKTKGSTDLDDYDYGVEDGEYEFEPYDPEAEGGGTSGDTEDDGA